MSKGKGIDRGAANGLEVRHYEDPVDDATETSRLLSFSDLDGQGETARDASQSRWDGYDDFEGFPWWRKPSVRLPSSGSSASPY